MGSRIRENPERLFELFVEVARPELNTEPFILQSFPQDYPDKDVVKSVSKFAFPCSTDVNIVDHFTFVLTDIESMYRFGFCRHATGAQTCLCFISFLPWYEVFYNLLNYIAELLNTTGCSLDMILQAMYIEPIPLASIPVTIVADQHMFSFTSPDTSKLRSIPESRNLTEYYNAIDTDNMMKVFASMLNERRVLVTSRKLSRLTACVHAAATLLYPMHWQHLYIPVMPQHLLDYCSAPMPYIIGVHSSIFSRLRKSDLGEVVIVDADKNIVDSDFDDLANMPHDVVTILKKSLRFQHNDPKKSSISLTGVALPTAFLRALVRLIGGYRDALHFRHGEPITFDPVAFVQTRPPHMQPFLENVLHLQLFQQFINDRLDMLNCGQGFNDLFETEASLLDDKFHSQSRYKDWSTNMKKQGKRFQKGGKVVWSRLQKTVRSKGHKAYKGIRSRIQNLNKDDEDPKSNKRMEQLDINSHTMRSRPGAPNRLAYSMVTHHTLPRSSSSGDKPLAVRKSSQDRTSKQYKLLTLDEKSVDDIDAPLNYNRVSINLLNDPDILRAMKKSISLEDVPTVLLESSESVCSSDGSDGRGSDDMIGQMSSPSGQYSHLIDDVDEPVSFVARSPLKGDHSATELTHSLNVSERDVTLRAPPRKSKVATGQKLEILPPKAAVDRVPVPAPRVRKSSLRNMSTTGGKTDHPSLIKLDSTDSESDISAFDPLADGKSKPKRQPSFPRVAAIRVDPNPLLQPVVNERSSRHNDSIADLFDPLCSAATQISDPKPDENSVDLIKHWELGQSVATTVNVINTHNSLILRHPDVRPPHNGDDLELKNVSVTNIQQRLLNQVQKPSVQKSYSIPPKYISTSHAANPMYFLPPTVTGASSASNNPFLSYKTETRGPCAATEQTATQRPDVDPFADFDIIESDTEDRSPKKWETFD